MLVIGDVLFDAATRTVFRAQQERKLSPKAAAVLLALAELPGQVWSRDALLERVWARTHVGEEVLTHAIAELRRAFGDDFRAPRYLGTVHKGGYRLLCSLSRTDDKCAEAPQLGLSGSLNAYADYLAACDQFDRGGRQATSHALSLFLSVLADNPAFALAHVGVARAMTFLATYYGWPGMDLAVALDHCATAHRLVSPSPEAFAAEGLIHAIAGETARSRASFGAAISLRPELGETHYLLGRACLSELDFDLAAAVFERAAALRADDYHSLILAGKARLKTDDATRARADFAHAMSRIETRLARDPDDCRALCAKARSLWQTGRGDEAWAMMDKIAAHPDPLNYHAACTFARAGEHARAMDVLEQVIDLGWRHGAWLERDPDLDVMRGDRRFKRIARSVGAAA